MSSKIGRLKKIVSALRRGKAKVTPKKLGRGYSLEELVALTHRKSLALEERIPRNEILMKRNEILYRLDPLIWAGVNKLTRLVASPRIYFTGEDETEVVAMEMFINQIGLRAILPMLIKDVFIYGYGVAEIQKDKHRRIAKLVQIDPKTFDYIRIEGSTFIDRKRDGTIKGYVQKIVGQEDKFFKPNDVIILKFYVLGEECLGLPPLEPVYKSAWIKLNLEEALGEAVYRHGYPIYWYKLGSPEAMAKGFEVTPDKIKEAKDYLKDLSTASELILPWWIEPGRVEARSQIGDISDFLQFLSAEIMAGLEVPKVYGTTTVEVGTNVAQETLDFEKTIRTLQEIIGEQLEEQLFSQYRKKNKMEFPYPKLNFTEYSEQTKMFKARRLSLYSKYHMVTPDINLENDIRKIEGLTARAKIATSKECVFGLGECPVRAKMEISLDKLAKFCSTCFKQRKGEIKLPIEGEEEIEEGKEE